ncbi:MAG TPA: glutathione S-transferase family protein [Candidatus Binatia bacterium]|jgi:glutathione S-transferase|nr:glutathione S-transferase family protein [Tepidisphaeraceae bacterium]
MAVKLYQSETSMFCEKVRIVLRMKNVPYEVSDVRPDRQPLIDFSGQRKIPVMDYNGQCIIDSTFISAFLEQKYPQNSIYPKPPSDKGLCLMLEDWADEVVNSSIRTLRRAETPEARQEAAKGLEIHFHTLDQFFNGKQFIFGQTMTLADIAIFVQLHYLYTVVKHEIPAEHRHLLKWMDLMRRSLKLDSLQAVAA